MAETDSAYVAALLDGFGVLKTRRVRESEMPIVMIQGRQPVLPWLAEATGVKLIEVRKGYSKHQCGEHCPDRHMDIASISKRWVLLGTRATVLLHNVAPYLKVHGYVAGRLIAVGLERGYQTTVANDMKRLGWTLPDLKTQPRARLALA